MIAIDAEFFVAVGFTIFLGVLIYVGAHKRVTAGIDSRVDRIKGELAEAERLRREAEELLASFERKTAEAEAEAKSIVEQAKREAEMIAQEARERLDEFVARGERQVTEKIAQAEAQASAEVRAAAADAAIRIAQSALQRGASGKVDFVSDGIAQLKSLIN